MTKTHRTVMVIYKIGKTISKIAFVFCLIGVICLAITLAAFISLDREVFESLNIMEYFEIDGINLATLGISSETIIGVAMYALIASTLACVVGAVVAKFCELYFKNTLAVGTPFTIDGSNELLRLGIIMTALPVILSILSSVIFSVLRIFFEMPEDGFELSADISTGVFVILLSFIFKFGAETIVAKSEPIVEEKTNENQF